MPNYDYACSECGNKLEIFQKITDSPITKCPSCQKEGLKRGVGGGAATFRFKGDGFYITDYKKECSQKGGSCACKHSSTSETKK